MNNTATLNTSWFLLKKNFTDFLMKALMFIFFKVHHISCEQYKVYKISFAFKKPLQKVSLYSDILWLAIFAKRESFTNSCKIIILGLFMVNHFKTTMIFGIYKYWKLIFLGFFTANIKLLMRYFQKNCGFPNSIKAIQNKLWMQSKLITTSWIKIVNISCA